MYVASTMYRTQLVAANIILKLTHTHPGEFPWINITLVTLFLRLPSLVADIGIGYLVYLFGRNKKQKILPLVAVALFLFSPVVLYNSAFWGQMDGIINFLFLLSVFLLMKKKHFLSLVFFAFSIYIKFSLIPLFPLYILLLYFQEKEKKKFFLNIFLVVLVVLAITFPISHNPIHWLLSYSTIGWKGEMQNITAFAFNFWWVIFKPVILSGKQSDPFLFSEIRLIGAPLSSIKYFSLSLETISSIIFSLFYVPLLWITLKKRKFDIKNMMLLFSLAALITFLFLPRMHERYLYPIFPLLAVYIGIDGKFIATFIALTILNFINIYIVWHPFALWFLPYAIFNNRDFQWFVSLCTVICGVIFYINAIKIMYAKK